MIVTGSSPVAEVHDFKVTVEIDWSTVAAAWQSQLAVCTKTPFQGFGWLDAWYRHIAPAVGATPRLVTVRDQATDKLVMLLPLISMPGRLGQILRFADEDLTDFNAPALGPVAVAPGREKQLWRALTIALPGHVSACFRKLPATIQGRSNPLVTLFGAHPSSVASNAITLDGTFETYHATLDRRVRMELERCWRVLQREHAFKFEAVTDAARAHELLDIMDRQQRERLTEIGSMFSLDEPAQAAHYRHDLARRLANGTVILTALRVGEDVIACQYAVSDGHTAIVLRISNAGKAWSRVSPGRLIVHKSIEQAYQSGHKVCDLSIGDYDYKRRFDVVRTPLVDLVTALSWRGRPAATRHWAATTLRRYPVLDEQIRRLTARHATRRTKQTDPATPST